MSYERKKADERRILDQYDIATTSRGVPSGSRKSNVLFLERYLQLLVPGGELLTVIDNTVLNGTGSQRHRDFILQHFVIRQVISLPFNTFFRAQANVQTSSILHLKKKGMPSEGQGHVFMAILNNVGHDDHQLDTPERDNLPALRDAYEQWCETGNAPDIYLPNAVTTENLGCPFQAFSVRNDDLTPERLDAFYYAPELCRTRQAMLQRAATGTLSVVPGRKFYAVPNMGDKKAKLLKGQVYRYFEIGDVTPDGAIIRYREDVLEALPSRARLEVRQNDVLFARNNSSRGTAVIVPAEFDGLFVTTGFMAIRPRDEEEALLLWTAITSEQWRKQIYYLAVTAVQLEVRKGIFQTEMLVPLPILDVTRHEMIANAKKVHDLQRDTWSALQKVREVSAISYEGERLMKQKSTPDIPAVSPRYKGAIMSDVAKALMRPQNPEARKTLARLQAPPDKVGEDRPAVKSHL